MVPDRLQLEIERAAAFEQRLQNDEATEFATAIREIHKIARLRLEAMS